ncbi:MAG: TPM domain-containing protein [Lachnospiraceae bacterium]|nr:TPM domain-containing protein [Lachnospiraceae bacterium]
MKKNGKAVFLSTCVLTLLLSLTAFAAGTALVDDKARLLSAEEIASLTDQATEIAESSNWDIMLVTADDAEGKTSEEYGEDYYMENKTTLDGVIYLIDMDNRNLKIATSGDALYYLTDDRIETMLDHAEGYAGDGEYYNCLASFLNDTVDYIEAGIPEDQYMIDSKTGEIVRYQKPKSITVPEVLIALLIAAAAGAAVFAGVAGKYTMKWGNYSYDVRENSSLKLRRKEDFFVNRIVTQRRIPKDPPPSSGGSSTTTHTGSGGNTFGGGERGF